MNQCHGDHTAGDELKEDGIGHEAGSGGVCETLRARQNVTTQSRIRGNYENKIRFFSPPEKMFEVFASVKGEDGKLSMNYKDLIRSITPYNYGELQTNENI